MRKIRDLLFAENAFSATIFPFGMMAIMVIVWMLMKRYIFGYFIWQDEVHSGVILHYIYVAVGWRGDAACGSIDFTMAFFRIYYSQITDSDCDNILYLYSIPNNPLHNEKEKGKSNRPGAE